MNYKASILKIKIKADGYMWALDICYIKTHNERPVGHYHFQGYFYYDWNDALDQAFYLIKLSKENRLSLDSCGTMLVGPDTAPKVIHKIRIRDEEVEDSPYL